MNSVSYFEIQGDDPKKLAAFYTAIFDWKFIKDPSIPIDYWRIENAGPFGGLLKRPVPKLATERGINAYVCSVHVENFDRIAEAIVKHGGQIALPKFAVIGKCWQGYFIDPQGNTFGIFEVDPKAA